MKKRDFTSAFSVSQTPEEVFAAVKNVRGWWSEAVEGSSDRVGAKFRYRHKDLHLSTQEVTELVPYKKVVWRVLDSRINFVKDKAEWKGTDIVFDIARKGARTELRLTHVGLVPDLECFNDCSGGWRFYFNGSLRGLITTGKGRPDPMVAGSTSS